jgi:hypothetical protein
MAVVEFDLHGRTYRVELVGQISNNVHSMNLIRDKVTLSVDMVTGDKLFVDWSQIPIMRLIS